MPVFSTDQIVAEIWPIKVIAWIHPNQHKYTPVMLHLIFNHLPKSTPVISQLLFNHQLNPKLTIYFALLRNGRSCTATINLGLKLVQEIYIETS